MWRRKDCRHTRYGNAWNSLLLQMNYLLPHHTCSPAITLNRWGWSCINWRLHSSGTRDVLGLCCSLSHCQFSGTHICRHTTGRILSHSELGDYFSGCCDQTETQLGITSTKWWGQCFHFEWSYWSTGTTVGKICARHGWMYRWAVTVQTREQPRSVKGFDSVVQKSACCIAQWQYGVHLSNRHNA